MSEKEETLIDLAQEFANEMNVADPSNVQLPEPEEDTLVPPKSEAPTAVAPEGNTSEILEQLLAKTKGKGDWIEVVLPSRGLAYVQAPEKVRIRPFNFEDEKALKSITSAKKGVEIITRILSNCIQGIDYQSLTLSDKNYLLFQIRKLSYGNSYKIHSTCTECGEENKLTLQIDQIPVNYAPDDYIEPFSIVLPDSEQEIKFVSPRVVHEANFMSAEAIMENLYLLVTQVNEYKDPHLIRQFIEKTTVRDVSTLAREIFKSRYGMDQTIHYNCASCGSQVTGEIGLDQDFFSPS